MVGATFLSHSWTLSLILLALLSAATCFAADSKTHYEQLLQESREAGQVSAALFYNLGVISLQSDDLGGAVLWLRRAARLEPRARDIQHNLAAARSGVLGSDTTMPRESGLTSAGRLLLPGFILGEHLRDLLFVVIHLLFCSVVCLVVAFHRRVPAAALVFLTALQLLFAADLFVVTEGPYGEPSAALFKNTAGGVVMKPDTKLYAGKSDTFDVLQRLPEGAELSVLAQRDEWMRVLLPSGETGWLKREEVEII